MKAEVAGLSHALPDSGKLRPLVAAIEIYLSSAAVHCGKQTGKPFF